jgi:hypothetical protein
MEYLFVGGKFDGKRVLLSSALHLVALPVSEPIPATFVGHDRYICTTEATVEYYHHRTIGACCLYVHSSLTVHEAIKLLMERYPNE